MVYAISLHDLALAAPEFRIIREVEIMAGKYVIWFNDEGSSDISRLGGKNASLGEMTRNMRADGIPVPEGFGITAEAYWAYMDGNNLREPIKAALDEIANHTTSLEEAGARIRKMVIAGRYPQEAAEAIRDAYRELCRHAGVEDLDVAVRSSATAEDLPDASFAGQQESFLNVRGERELLSACRRCLASLFTDRAITYRDNRNFDHMKVALSIGVQRMVHSDRWNDLQRFLDHGQQ